MTHRNFRLVFAGLALITALSVSATVHGQAVIVDHTSTDLKLIPDQWITRARQNLKMYYGHTSHGAQITSGLANLQTQYGNQYGVTIASGSLPSSSGSFVVFDAGTYDFNIDFMPTVDAVLDANPQINLAMYMWCGQHANPDWQAVLNSYTAKMQLLEQRHPQVKFIYATGNAQEQDCSGCVRNQFNEQLRQFVRKNNKILFDFADLDVWANGKLSSYPAPNWCAQYGCATSKLIPYEHPLWGGGDYNNPCGHAMPVSCDNKAKAFWWLLARLAGWDGVAAAK